jgi:hypothetical protein
MIKFQVTKPNVRRAGKGGDQAVPVGTVLELQGDTVPTFLQGKGIVVGEDAGKTLEPAGDTTYEVDGEQYTAEELGALYEEVTGNKPGNKKPETLLKELTQE